MGNINKTTSNKSKKKHNSKNNKSNKKHNSKNNKSNKKHNSKSDKEKESRKAINKSIREEVWVKYHGIDDKGICYCCGIIIQKYNSGWHCSHVLAYNKGGEDIVENLRTCCKHCNLSMGNQNLYVYIVDKNLTGPGSDNAKKYVKRHPSKKYDKRTNNWGN